MHKKRNLVSIAVMAVIVLATFWAVLGGGRAAQVWSAMKLARWPWLALGGFLMVCYSGMEAAQHKMTLKAMGYETPYVHCYQFAAAGLYFSSITPSSSGGQPAQVFYMTRRGIPAAHAALVMLLFSINYQLTAVAYGLASWIAAPEIPASLGTGLGVLLGYGLTTMTLLTAGMVTLLVWPRPVELLCRWVLRLGARIRVVKDMAKAEAGLERHLAEYAQGAALLKSKPLLTVKLLCAAAVQLGLRFLIPWTVFRALGLTGCGPVEMVSTQALVALAVGCLPIPGAVGAAEGAFLTAYRNIFGPELVTAAMVLCRGLAFYLPVLATGISTMILHRQTAKSC